uniref:Uncharacterized protein n=1 Tax=viral metagenome TaxID=1070528 RepID=A0A6M3LEZ9_9ZZZZ
MTTKNEMIRNVRKFCGECMGGDRASTAMLPIKNPADVEGCTALECIWFDFRMGHDPNPNKNKVLAGKERGFPASKEHSV